MDHAHILVAEDSPTQALQIQALLEDAGFQVSLTRDGREALDRIQRQAPDLVVTDLEMPELNGLELVRAAHVEWPDLPIVLTTARGSELIAAEALRSGAASYVPKSFLTDLGPTLHRLLAVKRADQASGLLAACLASTESQWQLPNDPELLPALVAHLQKLIIHVGVCDSAQAMQVGTALDEALNNAMIHGNLEVTSDLREAEDGKAYHRLAQERCRLSPWRERRVFVRAKITPEAAEFVIRDEGPGFDPRAIRDPTDPAHLDKISGRGLWLIHAFMHEVRHNERGNEVTMTRRKRSAS